MNLFFTRGNYMQSSKHSISGSNSYIEFRGFFIFVFIANGDGFRFTSYRTANFNVKARATENETYIHKYFLRRVSALLYKKCHTTSRLNLYNFSIQSSDPLELSPPYSYAVE